MMRAQIWATACRGFLVYLLLPCFLTPQSSDRDPSVSSTEPSSEQGLRILVVEGDGAINNTKQRVAREPMVEVRDSNNQPVAGALVSFALPRTGPSGVFNRGTSLLRVQTDAAGRAVASGLRANNAVGSFQINVTASFQGQTATAVIAQSNVLAAAAGSAAGAAGTGGAVGGTTAGSAAGVSATTIAVIAGAAAAGGIAAVAVATNNESTATPTTPPATIGTPGTPVFGPSAVGPSGKSALPLSFASRTTTLASQSGAQTTTAVHSSAVTTTLVAAAATGAAIGAWWYVRHRNARHEVYLSPKQILFGEVAVGQSAPAVLSLENRSQTDLVVESISLPGRNFRIRQRHQSPFLLRAGATEIVPVAFRPASAGPVSGRLVICLSDPGHKRSTELAVNLSGSAPASAVAALR